MKTKQINLYEFKELKKEVKEKVLEHFKNDEYAVELTFFQTDVEEDLKTKGWNDIKLSYSLSCCQGDGLSFSGYLDLDYFLTKVYSKKLFNYKKEAIKEYIHSVLSEGNKGRYCYSLESDIDFNYNYQDDREFKHLEKLWNGILKEIKEYYVSLCAEYETQGYNEIDHQLSDEYIIDMINNNEYEFLEDGTIF